MVLSSWVLQFNSTAGGYCMLSLAICFEAKRLTRRSSWRPHQSAQRYLTESSQVKSVWRSAGAVNLCEPETNQRSQPNCPITQPAPPPSRLAAVQATGHAGPSAGPLSRAGEGGGMHVGRRDSPLPTMAAVLIMVSPPSPMTCVHVVE